MRIFLLAVTLSAFIASSLSVPALACGPGQSSIPPVGAGIDELLPEAKLPAADLATVKGLRARIAALASDGKEQQARRAEEQAMELLVYKKMWLACGPGTFMWVKV
jgi:hypothetical protein